MKMHKKLLLYSMLISLTVCPVSKAHNNDAATGIFGLVLGICGTLGVQAIIALFTKKPLDQSGSIYRENMRPKEGYECECRNIVRMLEINDHALRLDDKQGHSEGKTKIWAEQNSLLNEYRSKCNATSQYDKKF